VKKKPSALRGIVSRALPQSQVPEGCPFCRESALAPGVLFETAQFVVVCDRAPLAPGHLLIIPRLHLACYGALPRALDAEFDALKVRLAGFLGEAYGEPLFFEHGLVGQTVPHAHLHAVPGVAADAFLDRLRNGSSAGTPKSPASLRRWYDQHGAYLYGEALGRGCLRAPGDTSVVNLRALLRELLGVQVPAAEMAPAITREARDRWRQFEQANGRPTTRVVTCFLEHAGRVCLLKRSEAVGSGRGKWHAVSGYLPEGKDPLAHAYDELAEETGLTPGHLRLQRHVDSLVFADRAGGRPWEVDAFLFMTATPAVTLNWEHVEFAWVAPTELGAYDCLPWLSTLYEAVAADGAGTSCSNNRP
jgi:8-oxo-dGTP diphosphatase